MQSPLGIFKPHWLQQMDLPGRRPARRQRPCADLDTLEQMELTDTFWASQPKAAEHTFFSSAHGTFSRTDHMLGHKTSLSKFRKTEIISSFSSDHNAMKLEISHKENTEKHAKTWELNNILFNKQWMGQQWDQGRNQKMLWNKWKWGHNNPKSVGHRESNPKREIHSITGLSQIIRKRSSKQSNFTLKGTWTRTSNKSQSE